MNKIVKLLVWLMAGAVLWFTFAPSEIGGRASWVTIQGISMQPNLYTNDLVLLHAQPRYQVGDAVAYRAQNMAGAVVLHRIIEIDGDRYVLQGDNNNFIDEYRPTYDDVLGKWALHIPQGSKHLEWLKTPWALASAVAVAGLTLVWSFLFVKRSRHRRQKGKGKGSLMSSSSSSQIAAAGNKDFKGPHVIGNPTVLWFFAVLCLVAAVVTQSMAPTTQTPEPRPYSVTYDFDYTATLPPGNLLYENPQLIYGQPVFLSVTDTVQVSVKYSISNPNVRVDNAQLRLKTVLIGSAGWQRTLGVATPVDFVGTEAATGMELNFSEALALGKRINEESNTNSDLRVAVVAETYVDGELLRNGKGPGGVDERTFADFGFNLDETVAETILPSRFKGGGGAAGNAGSTGVSNLPGSGNAGASSETGAASSETGYTSSETGYTSTETGYTSTETGFTSNETGYASSETGYANSNTASANSDPAGANSDPAGASSNGGASSNTGSSPSAGTPATDPSIRQITQMVPTDVNVPATIDLGLVSLPVGTVRLASWVLAGVLAALAIVSTLTLVSARRRGTLGLLVARYGKRMVPMDSIALSRTKDAIDLPTFDALYAVSTETEQLIVFRPLGSDSADFYVADNGTTYRFALRPEIATPEAATPEAATPEVDGNDADTHDADPAVNPDATPHAAAGVNDLPVGGSDAPAGAAADGEGP